MKFGPALRLGFLAFALTVTAAGLSGCGSIPARPEVITPGDTASVTGHLGRWIDQEVRAAGIAGLSIALVDDQQVVWSHATGWADAATRQPATAGTRYRVASVSKLFTVSAALQLAREGRLDLDAPLQTVLPEFSIRSPFPTGAGAITLRQLMTHHAGLPRDVLKGMFSAASPAEVLAAMPVSTLIAPPGQRFSYSNVGLTLLGLAIKRVTGTPFEAWMQQHLLDPAGLPGASFSQARPDKADMAQAHRRGLRIPERPLRDTSAGGLNASVLDLARFVSMVFANGVAQDGQRVLDAADVAEMLRPQNADSALDFDVRQGLGWMLSASDPVPLVGAGPLAHHSGATLNFHTRLITLPQHRLGVIVASNDSASTALIHRVAFRALALLLESRTGQRQPDQASPTERQDTTLSDEAMERLAGDYTTVFGWLPVRHEGQRLTTRLGGQRIELVPQVDGSLRPQARLLGLIPVRSAMLEPLRLEPHTVDGRVVWALRRNNKRELFGERLPSDPVTDPATLSTWVGLYLPVLSPDEYSPVRAVRLQMENGRLYSTVTLEDGTIPPGQARLQLRGEDEAVLLGPLAGQGEVVRRRRVNGQTWLYFNGFEAYRAEPRD